MLCATGDEMEHTGFMPVGSINLSIHTNVLRTSTCPCPLRRHLDLDTLHDYAIDGSVRRPGGIA